MPAILTKYLGPTDTKGSRIKASCQRGSITVVYDYALNSDENHVAAAQALCDKFIREDTTRYKSEPEKNSWGRPRACGCLPDNTCAHVFI